MQLPKGFVFLVYFIILSPIILGCSKSRDGNRFQGCLTSQITCLEGTRIVKIITNKGQLLLELNGNSAPLTAGNFLDLASKGVYNDTIFHRVVKKPFPFVIQGGDPYLKNNTARTYKKGTGFYIDTDTGVSRFIPLEIKLGNEELPRYNVLIKGLSDIKKIQLKHEKGSISMARSEAINSASSQFYFSLKEIPELNGRYSVFGKIVKGLRVLESIEEGDYIVKIIPSN